MDGELLAAVSLALLTWGRGSFGLPEHVRLCARAASLEVAERLAAPLVAERDLRRTP